MVDLIFVLFFWTMWESHELGSFASSHSSFIIPVTHSHLSPCQVRLAAKLTSWSGSDKSLAQLCSNKSQRCRDRGTGCVLCLPELPRGVLAQEYQEAVTLMKVHRGPKNEELELGTALESQTGDKPGAAQEVSWMEVTQSVGGGSLWLGPCLLCARPRAWSQSCRC